MSPVDNKRKMVPTDRLELSRVAPPPPQDGVSTNSTTSATNRREIWYRIVPQLSTESFELGIYPSPFHEKTAISFTVPFIMEITT